MNHPWQKAKILESKEAALDIKSVILELEISSEHRAGQHYEICLPGENIIRKYSIVSPVGCNKHLEFGIQLIPNGALSPKLWDLKEGSVVEIRGPLGESFVWSPENAGPIVLIGAGSGITPLLSIYDSYSARYEDGKSVFIMSAKDASRIMHYEKLKPNLVTRFTGTEGRIDLEFLKKHVGDIASDKDAMCYICGPDNFIDDMVDYVLELGFKEENIKSERFI